MSDQREAPREDLDAPATVYDRGGNFLVPCKVQDISAKGAKLHLFKETALPTYFMLSLMPDGSERRLCARVWQLARVTGVRFVEKS